MKYKIGITGTPIILEHTVAYVEAMVKNSVNAVTHTIFIGEIVDVGILSEAEPITYAYYHEIKRGKSPKTAPTYIEEKSENYVRREVKKHE